MNYRTDRRGNPVSALGYGCMRFSRKGSGIDYEKAQREILRAVELGVTYLDTAYIYPGSEECVGKIVESNNLRSKVTIATKLPQYIMKNEAQIEKTFREELSRLRTDYIDYYLMHMFTDYAEWEHLQKMGIEDWIARHKADGSVRQIGFSFHGDTDMFLKILNAYDWDFCQIQYNYLDEHSQAGRKGLEAAYAKGVPVIIMEPLRGGKLVNLPQDAMKLVKEAGFTPAELGLRWLWNQPGVTCVLSGMNSLEMVEENCRIAADSAPGHMSGEALALVDSVKAIFKAREKVSCTGCRYCMPCPKGVDIPGNFYYYNMMSMESPFSGRRGFFQTMAMRAEPGFAAACVGCGKCEKHCPQHLPIREKLKEADKALRPFPYNTVIGVTRAYMRKKKKI